MVNCFSGFMTGIAGELRAGTGCMQCGELGSVFMTGAGIWCMQCGELHCGFRPDVANFMRVG